MCWLLLLLFIFEMGLVMPDRFSSETLITIVTDSVVVVNISVDYRFEMDLTKPYSFISGTSIGTFMFLYWYGFVQPAVQRYSATRSLKHAKA